MQDAPVSIGDVIKTIPTPWEQCDLIMAPDIAVRIAQFDGEFPWHEHAGEEIFLCWQGSFTIEMADRETAILHAGDLYAVPRGVRHRPVARKPAYVLMIELPETTQHGI
jgi:mannose-6-phosphate isomerase-like protein (cupin superfamily)